jgi:hypothetical protein
VQKEKYSLDDLREMKELTERISKTLLPSMNQDGL